VRVLLDECLPSARIAAPHDRIGADVPRVKLEFHVDISTGRLESVRAAAHCVPRYDGGSPGRRMVDGCDGGRA
jgi:hypothetical protein